MVSHLLKFAGIALLLTISLYPWKDSEGQEQGGPFQVNLLPKDAGDDPPVPQGVEVMARGPVHEAFATPTTEAKPTALVLKKPPLPIEEMPPEEKPEGEVVWIRGYWAWDDDRQDYLWVSGCWRTKPPAKEWIAGYWREQGEQWQWVPGFWTSAAHLENQTREVTYYPEPPAPPNVAPPGNPPDADSFFVPGYQVWQSDRYVWRAGYWGRMRHGHVWIPAHYRWTPSGYVFIPGYWDLAVTRRGVLYAPVVVNVALVGPRFVYTPAYAVHDTIVLDALFVRPTHCHYYFGDYYGPRYRTLGYESVVVYSRRAYDPVIAYRRWECRDNPRWLDVQITLCLARDAGRAPLPPRTLVQQNTIIRQNVTNVTNVTNNTTIVNNNTTVNRVLAPTRAVTAARGQKSVPVDAAVRTQVQQAATNVQQAAVLQRRQTEVTNPTANPAKPRVASFKVPAPQITPPQNTPGTAPSLVKNPAPGASPGLKGPATNAKPIAGPILPNPQNPQDPKLLSSTPASKNGAGTNGSIKGPNKGSAGPVVPTGNIGTTPTPNTKPGAGPPPQVQKKQGPPPANQKKKADEGKKKG